MVFGGLIDDYQSHLPRLNEEEVIIRWSLRWYDGPLSGVAAYQNQFCLFEDRYNDTFRQRIDEVGQAWNDWYKPFVLMELLPEQQGVLTKQNELLRATVGNYWDYDESGNRLPAHLRFFHSKETHLRYDIQKQPEISFASNYVIGWFERLWGSAEQEIPNARQ